VSATTLLKVADRKWCAFCESDIEFTGVDPVLLNIVTHDEEGEAWYYAHLACLMKSAPPIIREHVGAWKAWHDPDPAR
jgi:hypothetical protein